MDTIPSAHEHILTVEEQLMEHTQAADLIKRLKEIKQSNEITYPRIMERMEKNGKFVSLTTLRRVFAAGSENIADSFNYENTLLPIAEALMNVEDVPTPNGTPYAKEIEGLKAVIRAQNEEIARLHDLKEHLDGRITFLLEQIAKKDEIISKLLEKVL